MTLGPGRGPPPAGPRAVLLLRWMVSGTALTTPARDTKVSRATAYRYLHEALGVIADRAPDLPEVLQRLRASEEPFVCLDGTLIRTDRVAQRGGVRGGCTVTGSEEWWMCLVV